MESCLSGMTRYLYNMRIRGLEGPSIKLPVLNAPYGDFRGTITCIAAGSQWTLLGPLPGLVMAIYAYA